MTTRTIEPTGRTVAEARAATETLDAKRAALAFAIDHVALLPAVAAPRRLVNEC